MKCLLFFPEMYSIHSFLMKGVGLHNYAVDNIDYVNLMSKTRNTIFNKTFGLPKKLNHKIIENYITDINKKYLEIISSEKPEIIIIYNNQFFQPELFRQIKKNTKVVFILGDNPLYTHTNENSLFILSFADLIISPDSFWTMQLAKLGIENIITDRWGYLDDVNYIDESIQKDIDTVFIGGNYINAAGYKRAKFYNELSKLNFQLHGPRIWDKWLEYFPYLKKKFILQHNRYSFDEINNLLNKSKVYAVENNPGLFNGIHIRFFECIGSGVLPIPEHTLDVEFFVKEFGLPTISNYSEVRSKTLEYIDNDIKREKLLAEIKDFVDIEYSPISFVKRVLNLLS